MSNLSASLITTASSMRAFESGLNVVQNNVVNASTPGYARQVQILAANAFQPDAGLPGGVTAVEVASTRNEYAERGVRRQQTGVGYWEQRVADLSQVEPIFDLREGAGVSGALSRFFQAVGQWSVAPNNASSRQVVLDRAGEAARAFNDSAIALQNSAAAADHGIRTTVEGINRLAEQLRGLNLELRSSFQSASDAGLDARLHTALEELSELVDYSVVPAADGSLTILLGGQTPLLIGDHTFPVTANVSSGQTVIADAQGTDITSQLHGGRLRALLDQRNSTIPGYLADLDQLASAFGDQVNAVLANGLDASGNAPSTPLFTYNPIAPGATLGINALTPADLAAASAGAAGGNGNTLALAALATGKQVAGFTYAEFYGNVAGRAGRDLSSARAGQETGASLLAQARYIRDQSSKVSLDEEAAHMLELQRSYQAAARMVQTISELTDTVVNLLR